MLVLFCYVYVSIGRIIYEKKEKTAQQKKKKKIVGNLRKANTHFLQSLEEALRSLWIRRSFRVLEVACSNPTRSGKDVFLVKYIFLVFR